MTGNMSCTHPQTVTGASGVPICTTCGSSLEPGGTEDLAQAQADRMYAVTTPTVPGFRISATHGIVGGAVVEGVGFGGDLLAGLANTFGGRSGSFESGLNVARSAVLRQMKGQGYRRGANALVGVTFDQQLIGGSSGGASMLMVTGTATSVVIEPLLPQEAPNKG